jgi:hypothetical protein
MDLLLHRFDLNLIGQQYATTLISTNQKKFTPIKPDELGKQAKKVFESSKMDLLYIYFLSFGKIRISFPTKLQNLKIYNLKKKKPK